MHDWVILVVVESVEALKTEFRIRKLVPDRWNSMEGCLSQL